MNKRISWPVRIFIIAAALIIEMRTSALCNDMGPGYSVSKKELDENCELNILKKPDPFDLKLQAFLKLKSEVYCSGKATQDCRVVFVSSEPLTTGYLCGGISSRFLSKSLPGLTQDEMSRGGGPATIDIVSVGDVVVSATIWSKEVASTSYPDSLDPSQPIGRAMLELGLLDGIKKWQKKDKKHSGIINGLRDQCGFSSAQRAELAFAAGYAISCMKLSSSTRISVEAEKLWWKARRAQR